MKNNGVHRLRILLRLLQGAVRIAGFLLLLDLVLFGLFDLLPSPELGQLGVFAVDPDLVHKARERMGISGTWYERLTGHWINLLHGTLGRSLVGNYPIGEVMQRRVLRSLPLWIGAAILVPLSILLAMPFAARQPNKGHHAARMLSQLASVPQFLSAVVLFVAWLFLADALSAGLSDFLKWIFAMVSCALLPCGVAITSAANTFQRCASEPYCDTYLGLGMSWNMIRTRLLRNVFVALRPLLARLLLWTITGSILTEVVFGIRGFGHLLVEAMRNSDLNVAQIWMLLVGGVVVVVTEIERR